MLLAGSLAFGLEALLVGLGGRLPTIYQRRRGRVIKIAFPIGLAITGLSIGLALLLGLSPLYLAALLLGFTFLSGKLIGLRKEKLFRPKIPPATKASSENEIKSMLKDRGFGELVKEEEKQEKN